MKEEDFIRKKCGSNNPFKVPEGYFEQFTANMMSQLPEKPHTATVMAPSHSRSWKAIWYAAAAVVCGAMFLGTYYIQLSHRHQSSGLPQTSFETLTEETYMNDLLDYTMVSNYEIASYLTDAY